MPRLRLTTVVLVVGLTGAAILTIARLLQPRSLLGIKAVALTPYAVPALLVVLGLAVVSQRGARRLLPALVAAALLAVHAGWQAPLFVGPGPATAPPLKPVKVMTVNGHLGQVNADRVVELVRSRHVDLLTVQEVDEKLLARLEAAGLDAELPSRAGAPGRPPYGTMVFADVELSDVREVPGGFGSWLVTADTKQGPLRFLAVHPCAPIVSSGAWWHSQAVVRRAAAAADVVAGDFNATLDHLPLLRLRDDGFRSAAEDTRAGLRLTWPAGAQVRLGPVPLPSLVQIDHVLVRSSAWRAVSLSYVEVAGSDHRAVLADLVPR